MEFTSEQRQALRRVYSLLLSLPSPIPESPDIAGPERDSVLGTGVSTPHRMDCSIPSEPEPEPGLCPAQQSPTMSLDVHKETAALAMEAGELHELHTEYDPPCRDSTFSSEGASLASSSGQITYALRRDTQQLGVMPSPGNTTTDQPTSCTPYGEGGRQ